MCATFLTHLNLDLITLKIFVEEYESCNTSLCIFLYLDLLPFPWVTKFHTYVIFVAHFTSACSGCETGQGVSHHL
jgi:hypothetical protein